MEIFDEKASNKSPALSTNEYLGLIMTLMYLARLSRPDVLLPQRKPSACTKDSTIPGDNKDVGMILHYKDLMRRT